MKKMQLWERTSAQPEPTKRLIPKFKAAVSFAVPIVQSPGSARNVRITLLLPLDRIIQRNLAKLARCSQNKKESTHERN
jgi:hypothetical protein